MRKPMIAGNWKMNVLPVDAAALVEEIWKEISGGVEAEVVVCPPFVDLASVSQVIRLAEMKIALGAQNMHWEDSGAFTGEVSPAMLLDLGVTHVIIGHSERRQFFGETDQGVNRKVKSAVEHGLAPIMCVGESDRQREAGETEDIVSGQVSRGLFEIDAGDAVKVVVAYEPIWAIGTGKAATAEDADQVISLIRSTLSSSYGEEVAEAVRILYGGSVKPENISELMSMPNIDGALVGGASLKADDFTKLVLFS